MSPRGFPGIVVLLLFSGAAGPACDPRAGAPLPLTALTLYATGVAYHERAGRIADGALAEIPVGPGQLDDVLKTIVILSEAGVASLEYDPPASPDAANEEVGLSNEDDPGDLASIAGALRGVAVRVEREDGAPLEGRLLGVERQRIAERDSAVPRDDAAGDEDGEATSGEDTRISGARAAYRALLVFGEMGLASVPIDEVISIRPIDPLIMHAWDRAARAQSRQPMPRSIRVRGASGGGSVTVGYTTEASVWRTTYRLILSESEVAPPRLQGFALVHNQTDEDWRGVTVTLVSGRPSSFLFPLASPRYSRRELVSPDDGLEPAPQLLTREARGHLAGSATGDSAVGFGSLSTSGSGGGYGYGAGEISHRIGWAGKVAPSDLLKEGPSPLAPAFVSDASDLFLYTVIEPVHLGARRSALLPIVDARIEAERVTIIDRDEPARLGVRLYNSTELTLEAGVMAVYADGAFAGETRTSRLKPGEVRVVTHGEDLDLEASVSALDRKGPARAVRRAGGGAVVHRVDRRVHVIDLTSRSTRPRTLLLALEGEAYRVSKGAEEDARSPGEPRYARVLLGPRERRKTEVVEEGAVKTTFDVFDVKEIDGLLSSGDLEEASRAALVRARIEAVRARGAEEAAAEAKKKLEEAESDVVRLRASVAAAGKSSAHAATDALASKLVRSEDDLARLRSVRERASKLRDSARKAVLDALD